MGKSKMKSRINKTKDTEPRLKSGRPKFRKGKHDWQNKLETIEEVKNTVDTDGLEWKSVPFDFDMDIELDGFGGIEELTDYGMLPTSEEGKGHEKSKQKKRKMLISESENPISEFKLMNSPKAVTKPRKKRQKTCLLEEPKSEMLEVIVATESSPEISTDMSKWDDLFVPHPVLRALSELGFTAPTPIQALTLPSAIRSRLDILGAAETGSGKTLAFGIPLLHGILQDKENEKVNVTSEPQDQTNTLEIEDKNDLEEASLVENAKNDSDFEDLDFDVEDLNNLESNDKMDISQAGKEDFSLLQEVREDLCPEIVKMPVRPLRALVLTPTRELALQVQKHIQAVAKYTDIRIALVVGGMAPQKQIRILKKKPEIIVATPGRLWELLEQGEEHLNHLQLVRYLVIDEADRMAEKGHFIELEKILDLIKSGKGKRQNFIFSATLTLVHDIPKRMVLKKKKQKLDKTKKLDSLMSMVGMKNKPKIVDLSKEFGTVDTLTEAKLLCDIEEKDLYLYYFWLTYPGRTLVFCNSIDCVRRLTSTLELLNCKPLPLHASMQQRQRLKNLDKFRDSPHALLLATDVAARGLDIPGVEHVIHYQAPRTAESYVHRSGRTARALNEGLSLMLLSSQEVVSYRKMCRTLNREKDLPDFPVEQSIYQMVQQRVKLARELEVLLHRQKKKSHMSRWLTQAAESLEIDIDNEDLKMEVNNDSEEQSKLNRKLKLLKLELSSLLQRRIMPRGILTNYPTKTGKLNLPDETGKGKAVSMVGNKVPWQQFTYRRTFKTKKKWKKKKNKGT